MYLLRKARKSHGRIDFNGLQVSIETGRSRVREWYNPHDGSQGMSRMRIPYGYIKGTLGTDGDHVDVFVGPDHSAQNVYVIHAMKAPDFTEYDEDKCMLGCRDAEEAQRYFFASYSDPKFYGGMSIWPFEEFKAHVLSNEAKGQPLHKALITIDDIKAAFRRGCKEACTAAGGDWNALIPEEFYAGMKNEMEHRDVTGGDMVLTAKIVLAHLREDRYYYSKLETMEIAKAMRLRAGIYR